MNPCDVQDCAAPAEVYVTDTRAADCARHHVCRSHGRAWNDRYARLANGNEAPPPLVFRGAVPVAPTPTPPTRPDCAAPVSPPTETDITAARDDRDVQPSPDAEPGRCRWPGCATAAYSRGLCRRDYQRANRAGILDRFNRAEPVAAATELSPGVELVLVEERIFEPVAVLVEDAPTADLPAPVAVEAPPVEPVAVAPEAVAVEPPAPPLDLRVSELERRVEAAHALALMRDGPPELCFDEGALTLWPDRMYSLPEKEAIRAWLYEELQAILDELALVASARIRARLRWLAFRPLDPVAGDVDDRPLLAAVPPSFEARCDAIRAALDEAGGWHRHGTGPLAGVDGDDLAMAAALGRLTYREVKGVGEYAVRVPAADLGGGT